MLIPISSYKPHTLNEPITVQTNKLSGFFEKNKELITKIAKTALIVLKAVVLITVCCFTGILLGNELRHFIGNIIFGGLRDL